MLIYVDESMWEFDVIGGPGSGLKMHKKLEPGLWNGYIPEMVKMQFAVNIGRRLYSVCCLVLIMLAFVVPLVCICVVT